MALKIINFTIAPPPVQSLSTSQFVLASFDVAALPGGVGNVTDCTLCVRTIVTLFEAASYSSCWEHLASIRRVSTGNPTLVGSVSPANGAASGRVGTANTSAITIDTNGTLVRLLVTPDSPSGYDWYGKMMVSGAQRV